MTGAKQAPGGRASTPTIGAALVLVVVSAVIGAASSVAGFTFSTAVHLSEQFLWHTVPGWWGMPDAPWWWVLAVTTSGGLAVAAAIRLPGNGGHHPLDGLSFDVGPRSLVSALLAAFAALTSGAVMGPEAPLLAIGSAIALGTARGRLRSAGPVLALSGAAAGIGVVLGNPLITAVLLLEVLLAARTAATRRQLVLGQLVPIAAALGAGYLMKVGIGDWTGLPSHSLGVDLAHYPTARVVDVLPAIAVALATALATIGSTRAAEWLRPRLPAVGGLAAGGLTIGLLAIGASALTDEPASLVLFSGQSDLSTVLGLTSAGGLLVIALAKTIAYGVSLGAGFRGGTVFPTIFLGAAFAAAMHTVAPETALPALAAAGVAAGVGAALGLPFTALLFGVLINSSAGPAVAVPAVLGALIGVLVAAWVDDRTRVQTAEFTET